MKKNDAKTTRKKKLGKMSNAETEIDGKSEYAAPLHHRFCSRFGHCRSRNSMGKFADWGPAVPDGFQDGLIGWENRPKKREFSPFSPPKPGQRGGASL